MELTERTIGAAIEVHRSLGPGLLESAYEKCMAAEMTERGIRFEQQYRVPLLYKGRRIRCGYRIDFLVEKKLVVELKVVRIQPICMAQMMTYLKLTGCTVGLLINFNVDLLKDGVSRVLNGVPDPSVCSVHSVVKDRSKACPGT